MEKADIYKVSQMIESLEMASIVIHCIKGEPAIKVRRMLDVPGNNYTHADHYCQQPLQPAVAYQPYREHRELVAAVQADPGANPPVIGVPAEPAEPARPAIIPVQFQPAVAADQCLRHYLIQLYGKRVNLSEAEKFLNTFKLQKTRQTCSNYLDEFVINYENYAHLKWTTRQLNGVEAVAPVQPNPAANPPVEAVQEVIAEPGNQELRNAEMIQLATDGICKEFKIHCDNIQYDLNETTFPELEQAVMNWQRSTTTRKQFTAACVPAQLGSKNVNVSALEMANYFESGYNKLAIIDAQTNSTQVSEVKEEEEVAEDQEEEPVAEEEEEEGQLQIQAFHTLRHLYNQETYKMEATIITDKPKMAPSINPYMDTPYVIPVGYPVTKGKNLQSKQLTGKKGLTRVYHPERDKAVSNHEKAKITAAATAKELAATASAAAAMSATPMMQYHPWSFPWTHPLDAGQAPFHGAVNP